MPSTIIIILLVSTEILVAIFWAYGYLELQGLKKKKAYHERRIKEIQSEIDRLDREYTEMIKQPH